MTASSPLSGVADRYAGALFELCTTAAKIKATEKDLDALDKSLSGSEDLTRLIKSPCLLYTSPSPRDLSTSRMPSSA